jgi:hypothetical protein
VTGKVLGSYEILDKLGEGGMGEVWRARDRRLHRTVAMKILPRDVASNPARRARFEQEARALGALNHPNIVTIFDVGQDDGHFYIVSELVDGESLRTVLDRGPLPQRKAIEMVVQMAEGIAAAHALGIVHRDLKPENVMVTRSGQIKLLDFGLAKLNVPAKGDNTATIVLAVSEPGVVMGTVGYMSPEQVRGEPLDARSDIFSLGCILYEMFLGGRAFDAPTGVETMHAILHEDPPDAGGRQARIRPALLTIINRCLEKRPEQRFQSAADLAFSLRSIASTSDIGIQTSVAASREQHRGWVWFAASITVTLIMFALGFLLRGRMLHPAHLQFQRITFRKGYVTSARFLPHSRNIVYQARWEDGPAHTYLAVPGSPDSRDLQLAPQAQLASISSQQEMAFLTAPFGEYGSGRLVSASISGGLTRPLLDGVLAADWSPDGSSLAVLRRVNGINRLEYPIGKVLADNIAWPLWMIRVSPDGSRVAYVRRFNGRAIELNVADRAGKVTSLGAVSGQNTTGEDSSLCWTPKGDEIWFRSFDPSEQGIVYAVDIKGRRRIALTLPSRVKFYDISQNGNALLSTGSLELGILGVAPGETAERDLSCLDSGQVASISDDGKLIAANITGESGGPKGSIYIRRTDGSPAFRAGDGFIYRMSPDGNWVAGYTMKADGSRRFMLLPTGPGEEFDVNVPGVQPASVIGWLDGDQRYMVVGHLQGRKFQCFAWDARQGTVRPVCPEGIGQSPSIALSPDRQGVLAPSPQGGWFVYPVDGEPARQVHGLADNEIPVGWRQGSRSLYVRPDRSGEDNIPVSIVDIVTGRRSPWKVIDPAQPILEIHDLHITPDGRAYAYNFVLAQSDLYVARGLE